MEHLNEVVVHKTIGPNRLHPCMLRDRGHVLVRPFSLVFERS